MNGMFQLLADHRFTKLFHDELGWDHSSGTVALDVNKRHLEFEAVAQKRGFLVLQCTTDRRVLFNRGLLRRTQWQIAKTIHEHILIYSCTNPPKQVWQWAVRMPDGRKLRHREHPFFSSSPPASLQDRLKRLRFTLDEEEDVTFVDALRRVREALDVTPELNLFVKRPWYAERSDELAVAMKRGDEAAFHAFVLLHRPLARHISKRLQRAFGMDPEDAEQIGILGLIQAARRFDPERGIQFSTYATHWVRQACQRFGPDAALFIRLPAHVAQSVLPIYRRIQRIEAAFGGLRATEERERIGSEDPHTAELWPYVERALSLKSLSDQDEPEYDEARGRLTAAEDEPIQLQIDKELRQKVREAMSFLNERQRRVLTLRYGLDGNTRTLEEISREEHITRERVRQIQVVAEKKLRGVIERELKGLIPLGVDEEPDREPPAHSARKDDGEADHRPGASDTITDVLSPSSVTVLTEFDVEPEHETTVRGHSRTFA